VRPLTDKPLFSQRFDLSGLLHLDPIWDGDYRHLPYCITDQQGRTLAQGCLDENGMTARVFTEASEPLYAYFGEGDWQAHEEVLDIDRLFDDEEDSE
jgi:hypothetical protein